MAMATDTSRIRTTRKSNPSAEPRRSAELRPPCDLETGVLFDRWQRDGDRAARDALVARFLPLACKLARRYNVGHEPLDDLVQVASLGLVKAVDRFDRTRGNAFSSFAVPTILGELKRYFRDYGWAVHVPRGAQELAVRVEEARQRLSVKSGRAPTVPQLAEYLELSIGEVLEALETGRAHHATSLDAPRDDGEGETATLAETLGEDDPGMRQADARMTVGAAAGELTEREREVLAWRFAEDLTQTEIAERIGVSQMQVSRILRRSIERLAALSDAGSQGPQPPASQSG
jgi:RNA polymerase sigma-B factor